MIVIAALLLGAILGGLRARSRGGSRLDIVHYAATYGVIFALVGLFATIAAERLL